MNAQHPLLKRAMRQSPWLYLALAVLVLLLALDFNRRVWVPVPPLVADDYTLPATDWQNATGQDLFSAIMLQWRESAEATTHTPGGADDTSAPAPLDGATELAGIRVRVRAIFLQQHPQATRLALLERQQADTGAVSFEPVRPGDVVGGYIVAQIQRNSVVFSPANSSPENAGAAVQANVFTPSQD